MADDNLTGGQGIATPGFQADDAKRNNALASMPMPSASTGADNAQLPASAKTSGGDDDSSDDSNDPKVLHGKFQTALANSRKKYADVLSAKPPKQHNSRLSFVNMLLGLAGTALDPSHQAGVAYVNGVSQGQQAQDARYNQQQADAFKRQQQLGLAGSQNDNEDAARFLAEEQAAQGRKDAKDKEEKDSAEATDTAAKATHDKLISDVRSDVPGYLKMLGPDTPEELRHTFAHMALNHVNSYGQLYGEAGYPGIQEDIKSLANGVLNNKSIKSPRQIKEEAAADEAATNAKKARLELDALPKKIKDTAAEIEARTGASKLQSQKLAQELSWAPKDHVLKIAKTQADLSKTYKEITEIGARTAKLRSSNGSSVYGNLTPAEVKRLSKTNSVVSETMKEQATLIKSADKWEADNTFGGKLLDPTQAQAWEQQKRIRAGAKRTLSQLTKQVHAVREKLGMGKVDDSGDE